MVVSIFVCMLLMILFYFLGKKGSAEKEGQSLFECGFSSYFFSRFSFCIHYFMVALTFLFLDLELCVIMPFFLSFKNSYIEYMMMNLIVLVLLVGLLIEWGTEKLDWEF